MSLPKLLVNTTIPLDERAAAALDSGQPNAELVWEGRYGNKIKMQRKIKVVPRMLLFSSTGVWLHSYQSLLT